MRHSDRAFRRGVSVWSGAEQARVLMCDWMTVSETLLQRLRPPWKKSPKLRDAGYRGETATIGRKRLGYKGREAKKWKDPTYMLSDWRQGTEQHKKVGVKGEPLPAWTAKRGQWPFPEIDAEDATRKKVKERRREGKINGCRKFRTMDLWRGCEAKRGSRNKGGSYCARRMRCIGSRACGAESDKSEYG